MTNWLLWTFVAVVALCALALLQSAWPRWARAALVLAVTGLFFVGERISTDLAGWPAAGGLPERFVLLAAVIEEPTAKSPGALYVWVQPIRDGKPLREPRGVRLAYRKDLHALLDEGMKKARQGVSQMGSAQPRVGQGSFFAWLKPGDDQVVKLRDMPLPQLPEK